MADTKISDLTDGAPAVATDELPISRTADVATRKLSLTSIATLFATAFAGLVHATRHQNGGADEISVAGLSGLLADGQTPLAHKTSHENGGTDEILVTGLSGLLADGQTPLAHKTSHESGGSDAIKLDDLSAPDDNTDLNVSITKHGLTPKLPNDAAKYLDGTGAYTVPVGSAGGAPSDAEYIVGVANGTLSAERVLTNTTTVQWDLATAAQAKANVPDAGIANAKLANMVQASIKGRAAAAGTGAPTDLNAAQMRTILSMLTEPVTSPITKNNNTVLGDITGLTFTIGAAEVWGFEVFLLVTSGGTGSDIKFGWTGPASFTMAWHPLRDVVDAGAAGSPTAVLTAAGVGVCGSINGTYLVVLRGLISGGGTGGAVQLQFAQNSAVAHDTTINIGSHLRAWKVI